MSEETLEIVRPTSKRREPARAHAKSHAPADAVLTQQTRCAIDLPSLAPSIPQTIVLSLDAKNMGCLTDSMLNLAQLGSDMPSFELNQDKTFVENVILAADHRLQQTIAPLKNSIMLRWWGSSKSAAEGSNPTEQGGENTYIAAEDEKHIGANAVIEFDLRKDGDVHHATTLLNSSEQLARCESVCPGFTHLLYTVLDCVNDNIWPVYTPRTFWNDMRYSDGWFALTAMCDAEIAKYYLSEYCSEDELAEKYGEGDVDELDPANAVAIYAEEVGGTLPSDFLSRFGRACIGEWTIGEDSEHESLPDPKDHIAADICSAMASVETRLEWCSLAPFALKQLAAMHSIVSQIANGARLARGANHFAQPSHSAIEVFRFGHERENDHFRRTLDDLARGAWECGETVEATGWYYAEMSNLDKANQAVSTVEQGVKVLQTTCTLLLDLFYDPNQDE